MKISSILGVGALGLSSLLMYSCGTVEATNDTDNDIVVTSESAPTTAEEDKFSYAFGLLIGSNLKASGLQASDLNYEELSKGLKAALGEGEPTMNMQEAQKLVNELVQQKQQAASAAAIEEGKKFLAENAKKPGIKTTASGLQYEVIKDADGAKPTLQDKVKVHYHGTLINGTVFDSSVERGEPISFQLTGVIKGWQEGLQLMPKGSKYRLYIPSDLGYGARPAGKIPANSVLIFDVELLGINE